MNTQSHEMVNFLGCEDFISSQKLLFGLRHILLSRSTFNDSGPGNVIYKNDTWRCWTRVGSAIELPGFTGNVETSSLVAISFWVDDSRS